MFILGYKLEQQEGKIFENWDGLLDLLKTLELVNQQISGAIV